MPEHHPVIRAVVIAVAGAAVLAAPAAAHVTISPTSSRPADLQQYRVLVPNEESDKDTTGIDVQLPADVDAALAQTEAGWRAQVVRKDGQPRLIRYRGGRIPPDGYFAFHIIVRNPVKTGTVTFKTLQHYTGGEVVRWIGSADSDQPSPRVTLSESATPVDVVSVHGETTPGATAAKPAAATNGDDDDGDGPALPIAIAALALAVVALGLSRRRG
jgi:MYXO-CTERM domain-containing protein